MMNLEDLRIFVTVAESGGFTHASKLLNISPAVASIAVKRLEKELGIALFIRSTRSVNLTRAGNAYITHAKSALEAIELGELTLAQDQGELSGKLNISVPSDLGRGPLRIWIDEFLQLHPKLELRLLATDHLSNFYQGRIDLAIRYGSQVNPNFYQTMLLEDNSRVVCASPEYIRRNKAPARPEDLLLHNCLCFMLNETPHTNWKFFLKGEPITIQVSGNRIANDGEVVRQWAVNGYGIAYKSRLDISEDIKMGKLVPLLEEYKTEAAPLCVITPHKLSQLPNEQALVIFLKQKVTSLNI